MSSTTTTHSDSASVSPQLSVNISSTTTTVSSNGGSRKAGRKLPKSLNKVGSSSTTWPDNYHYYTRSSSASAHKVVDELQGTLHKWTNYLKGYQKRWFVLKDGYLTYYRNQGEVGHTCRGSISLHTASISKEESGTMFYVSSGTQTFHLRAANDEEAKKWLKALNLARVRAIKVMESDDEMDAEESVGMTGRGTGGGDGGGKAGGGDGNAGAGHHHHTSSIDAMGTDLRILNTKINDLSTCQDLIAKHGASLLRAFNDTDNQTSSGAKADDERIRSVNERLALFKITTNAMINASNEFVSLASGQAKKWSRSLAHEHQQRLELQDQLQQLALQHARLERAAIKDMIHHGNKPINTPPSAVYSDSDDESLYEDAAEEINNINLDRKKGTLQRSPSEMSTGGDEDGDEQQQKQAMKHNFEKIRDAKIVQREGSEMSSGTDLLPTPSVDGGLVVSRKESARKRRSTIPPRPNYGLSLWSVMKNSIGKELSKIPMPVNFNEPLSMVQRLTEDMEYAFLLDQAAQMKDSCEQMCYVAAFTASSYGSLTNRTGKPFNPLLGETYECDRMDDLGWRTFCEQVSHHPPAAAQHVEGAAGWEMYQEFTMSSKFRGKYLSVIPLGISHLEFKSSKNHYTWRKVTTTVHNIIVGKLWIDNHGDMTIENHTTGDKCHIKYIPYSYFSRDTPRKVTGVVTDRTGMVRWVVQGTWDNQIECARVLNPVQFYDNSNSKSAPVFETEPAKLLWRKTPPLKDCEKIYNFTRLALELNEPEEGPAPTDSRNRPDQRLMETGEWDSANSEKLRLEEKQRAKRRKREAEAEQAMVEGRPFQEYEPIWFKKEKDRYTGNLIHLYNGNYWKCKEAQDWSACPDLY